MWTSVDSCIADRIIYVIDYIMVKIKSIKISIHKLLHILWIFLHLFNILIQGTGKANCEKIWNIKRMKCTLF